MTNHARSLVATTLAFVLFAPASAGGVITQMTDGISIAAGPQSLDDAGSVVIGASNANIGGQNPGFLPSIYSWDATSGVATLLWTFTAEVKTSPRAVSDDGAWVAFVTGADLTGGNPSGEEQLFLRRTDGSETRQLTTTTPGEEGVINGYNYALAGSGNRVVYISDRNPLGTNPSHYDQLFIVDADGTNLRQLTTATATSPYFDVSISDDGTRIAFEQRGDLTGGNPDGSDEIFAVEADGTNLRQLTSGSGSGTGLPNLSGNGARIAFWSAQNLGGQNPTNNNRIWVIDWSGAGLAVLPGSFAFYVAITDDGQYVFYEAFDFNDGVDAIWRVRYDGTDTTKLTPLPETSVSGMQVSGDGSRVAFATHQAEPLFNHGGDQKKLVMDGSGGGLLQLTADDFDEVSSPELTPDGTRLVFTSSANPLGTNPTRRVQVFRMQTDGSGLTQITAFTDGDAWKPSVSDDGQKITFLSNANPLGNNPSNELAPFAIRADGTLLTLLDTPTNALLAPAISGNGSWVVFQSASHSSQLMRVSATGTLPLQISNDGNGAYKHPRVDANGSWVVYSTNTGIWRVTTSNTNRQQIANYSAWYPDVSGNGTRYVWVSNQNPLGSNPDGSREIFSWDSPTNLYRQLTSLPADSTLGRIRISRDGNYVTFYTDAPIFGETPGTDVYRLHVATGTVERVGGLGASLFDGGNKHGDTVAISSNGSKLAFTTHSNSTGNNPDGSKELFFVDMTRTPAIRVSATSPTVVSWDADPHALQYDVIRGDVADLAAVGSNVDLGPVTCLANDTSGTETSDTPDAQMPNYGQAFFFLVRGSSGPLAGPGSYGQGEGGLERVAGAGACP